MYMMNFPNVHDYLSMGKTPFQFVARQHQHMQLLTLVFAANSLWLHTLHTPCYHDGYHDGHHDYY